MSATVDRQPEISSSGITVVPLNNAVRSDVERFVGVAWSPPVKALYAPYRDVYCPYTIDTLRRTLSPENPIFEHTDCQLFVATQNGVDAGRVVALHNPLSTVTTDYKLGFFGFFEAANLDVARALLLEGAWPWLEQRGLLGMVGNNNPTTNDEVGVLVQGYHRHIIMLEFNPPDYPAFLESLGFRKAHDVYSYWSPLTLEAFAPIMAGRSRPKDYQHAIGIMARRSGVPLEPLNKRDVGKVAREFCTMYNRAWRDHWGFEPMTSAELLYVAKDLLTLLPKELLIFARNKRGECVGGALCAPDLNDVFRGFDGRFGLGETLKAGLAMMAPRWVPVNPRPKTMRIVGLGVLPEYASKGAAGAMMGQVVYSAIQMGLTELNMSWILEDNQRMLDIPQRLGLKPDQTWRMYEYRPQGS